MDRSAAVARSSSSRWLDWLLSGLGIVLGLVILELGLRMKGLEGSLTRFETQSPVRAARWIAHPFLPYAGRPNARFEFRNPITGTLESIQTNSYGFRSHEFPDHKRPADFFVLSFGGSTTYGYAAASNRDTWPERLEAKLQAHDPTRNVKVFNLGLDMATSIVSVVNLALIGAHLHPDLVIVYHGYNDLAAIGARNFRPDHSHHYRDLDPEAAFRGIEHSLPSWMLSSYVVTYAAGASDMILRINDLSRVARLPHEPGPDRLRGMDATLQNLSTMHSIAASVGAETLFSTFQFRDGDGTDYSAFNRELRSYFARKGYWYVDLDKLIPDHDRALQVDECHFTPKGDDLVAQSFFDAIVERGLLEARKP
jgi:lysophospholipase L1-like esterase